MKNSHAIRTVRFDLTFDESNAAKDFLDRIGSFFLSEILPSLETIFGEQSPEAFRLFIDQLVIDLGPVEESKLYETLRQEIPKRIEKFLEALIWGEPVDTSWEKVPLLASLPPEGIFRHYDPAGAHQDINYSVENEEELPLLLIRVFLQTGTLPVSAPLDRDYLWKLFDQAFARYPAQLRDLILELPSETRLKRLAWNLPPAQRKKAEELTGLTLPAVSPASLVPPAANQAPIAGVVREVEKVKEVEEVKREEKDEEVEKTREASQKVVQEPSHETTQEISPDSAQKPDSKPVSEARPETTAPVPPPPALSTPPAIATETAPETTPEAVPKPALPTGPEGAPEATAETGAEPVPVKPALETTEKTSAEPVPAKPVPEVTAETSSESVTEKPTPEPAKTTAETTPETTKPGPPEDFPSKDMPRGEEIPQPEPVPAEPAPEVTAETSAEPVPAKPAPKVTAETNAEPVAEKPTPEPAAKTTAETPPETTKPGPPEDFPSKDMPRREDIPRGEEIPRPEPLREEEQPDLTGEGPEAPSPEREKAVPPPPMEMSQLSHKELLGLVVTFLETGAAPVSYQGLEASFEELAEAVQILWKARPVPFAEAILPFISLRLKNVPEYGKILGLLQRELENTPERQRNKALLQLAKKLRGPAMPQVIPEETDFEKVLEEESFYIKNAGLIIAWPFMRHLFNALKLLDEKGQFLGEEQKIYAAHVLEYVATKNTITPEYLMTLNKILCEIPFGTPIPAEATLEPEVRELVESMLRAIIKQWSALKTTSEDGLRGNFLIREGKLVKTERNWNLVVEQKAYDLLLDKLPWSISTVKLPWMTPILFVDWR